VIKEPNRFAAFRCTLALPVIVAVEVASQMFSAVASHDIVLF
jgi:hypothetical protein